MTEPQREHFERLKQLKIDLAHRLEDLEVHLESRAHCLDRIGYLRFGP
jgi:hypothetical protein